MKNILITGGAGFIGCNAAKYFMDFPEFHVIVFDNLSRKGTDKNLDWLMKEGSVTFINGDIRNKNELDSIFNKYTVYAVIHLAAQVAVTTSVINPLEDFEVNAIGTFNLLEATRGSKQKPIFIYSSTNKVYGCMEDAEVIERDGAYYFKALKHGVAEIQPLDFHSPYGCSKGSADQYVRDYNRIYGMPTVVLRQSCIYGERQFGIEDQGWVAWFIIASILGKQVSIYGDGKQVRDILFIDDLVSLYKILIDNPEFSAGQSIILEAGEIKSFLS